MVTLFVPRPISLTVLSLGLVWGGPTLLDLVTGGRVNGVFTLLNLLIGGGLVWFGVRTLLVRAVLTEEAIAMRSRLRTVEVGWAQVKGVALLQDGGVPRLRVVRREGPDVQVPAWSLRARYDDGEVEPAGPALERFGSTHGVKVKVRNLTGPVVE